MVTIDTTIYLRIMNVHSFIYCHLLTSSNILRIILFVAQISAYCCHVYHTFCGSDISSLLSCVSYFLWLRYQLTVVMCIILFVAQISVLCCLDGEEPVLFFFAHQN
ncbi:hypothetical protein CHS0354_012129 [Potamilus streckersoni]|uniref:Uncharacterized protein n=1 Tax=Potamilus streckersoni TaxID=2493646 RepID=A0AAE0VS65_9BIVA|nr:hypothetical protein CHS0354_012129 [Potamilus streckersoni]